jgi:hypothetical protein
VQKQGQEKEQTQIDVDVSPIAFCQPPQSPVSPIRHTPLGNDVKNDTGQYHQGERQGGGQRGDFTDFHGLTIPQDIWRQANRGGIHQMDLLINF